MQQAEPKEKRMKVETLEQWLTLLSNNELTPEKRIELMCLKLAWTLGQKNVKAEQYIQKNMGI